MDDNCIEGVRPQSTLHILWTLVPLHPHAIMAELCASDQEEQAEAAGTLGKDPMTLPAQSLLGGNIKGQQA